MRTALALAVGLFLAGETFTLAAEPRIVGRVIDSNGKPLSGTRASLFGVQSTTDTECRELAVAITGSDGRFELTQKKDTVGLVVTATKEGMSLDWVDADDAALGESVLRLGPPSVVDGQVVGEDGAAVPGATVRASMKIALPFPRLLQMPIPPLTTQSDRQGRFQFKSIGSEACVGFELTAPQKARAFIEPYFLPGSKGLRFVLPPEGRIEGVVVDKATGKGLADVNLVTTGSLTSGCQVASAKTGAGGRFSISGLTGGKYEVEIVGQQDKPSQWLGTVKAVQVLPGKTAEGVRIEASSGGTVEFELIDAPTGNSVVTRGAVTVLLFDDRRVRKQAGFDPNGLAVLSLEPGKYLVEDIYALDYAYKPAKEDSFTVEVGKTLRVKLAATRMSAIKGIACDPAGTPVSFAKVRTISLGGVIQDTVADANGEFQVDPRLVGPLFCMLLARHPTKNLVAMGGLERKADVQKTTLESPMAIAGKVVDVQDKRFSGATVSAIIDVPHMGRVGQIATTQSDADGRYRMELPRGSYTLLASAPGHRANQRIFELGIAEETTFVLKRTNRVLRGVVKDPDGNPLPGAVVWAQANYGPYYPVIPGGAVADEKGQFVLDGLTDDELIIRATAPGRGWIGDSHIGRETKDAFLRLAPSHWD